MIDAETINCWKLNYGLDNRTPADAMQWWHDNYNGRAPAGAVAALGLCLDEIEALKATISCLEKDNADALELLSSDVEEKHRLNMEYANAVLDLRDTISRLRHDIERHIAMASELATENERLRADLADCRMLLSKYSDSAQELREACDEKQRCIDSSVQAQRTFLAEIDSLRHDIERHIAIASDLATENERLRAELAKCKSLLRRVDGTTSIEWAGFKGIKEDIRAALATPSEDK